MAQDPSASDDSGRASERLISTSSGAPRDADSSRDRLSDVSVSHSVSAAAGCLFIDTHINRFVVVLSLHPNDYRRAAGAALERDIS